MERICRASDLDQLQHQGRGDALDGVIAHKHVLADGHTPAGLDQAATGHGHRDHARSNGHHRAGLQGWIGNQLAELLDHAAERGAVRCLAQLGLENGHAARDIRELRDLLDAWRDARRTAWQTIIKVVTTGILAALLVGAAIKLKLMGGVQ